MKAPTKSVVKNKQLKSSTKKFLPAHTASSSAKGGKLTAKPAKKL